MRRLALAVALGADEYSFAPAPAPMAPVETTAAPRGTEELLCKGEETRAEVCAALEPCVDTCIVIDGEWGDWSDWGVCACSGLKERKRQPRRQPRCGGHQLYGPEIDAFPCIPDCKSEIAVACELSDWTPWTPCDRECGGGISIREREIVQWSANNGPVCNDDLQEVQTCNAHNCDHAVDCQVGGWTEWTPCSASCGGGFRTRQRWISQRAVQGGRPCTEALVEVEGCSKMCCVDGAHGYPRDCAWGSWSDWGPCSASCGGGQRQRQREVDASPLNGGRPCDPSPVMILEQCNRLACGTHVQEEAENGLWAPWSAWSSCSRTCGGGLRYQERERLEAKFGGSPADGADQRFEPCGHVPCDIGLARDCEMKDWEPWSVCSATLSGTRMRARDAAQWSEHGGKLCAEGTALSQVEPCNSPQEVLQRDELPADCVLGDWRDWGDCSRSCDGGQRTRDRAVVTPPQRGGRGCGEHGGEAVALQQVGACAEARCSGDAAPDVDCVWDSWSAWGSCTVTCGGGESRRSRRVLTPAEERGAPCAEGAEREVRECAVAPCGLFEVCEWTDWEVDAECSVTCGGSGVRTKRRTLEKLFLRGEELREPLVKRLLHLYTSGRVSTAVGVPAAFGLATVLLGWRGALYARARLALASRPPLE